MSSGNRTPTRPSLSPKRQKAIFDFIGLIGSVAWIIDLLRRFMSGSSQFDDLRSSILIVVLAILILLELSEASSYLFVPLRYSVPLLLLSLGASLPFRSVNEIANTLLGGVVAVLVFFLLDRFYRVVRKQQGFDQGSLIAAFIAGLFVRGDRVIGLLFLAFMLPTIFYVPIFLIRRISFRQRVPIIPFLVLAAIATTTPYYDAAEIAYRNLGYEEQISAIQQFIEYAKKGDKTFSIPTVNGPEILVSYDKNPLPIQRVAERYRDTQPRLVHEFWESFREERKYREATKGQQTVEAFRDLNTGYIFLVSPTYSVIAGPTQQTDSSNK
jgi:prepilin signal peptidase PulO-like enzyme (type II secretory pathway)